MKTLLAKLFVIVVVGLPLAPSANAQRFLYQGGPLMTDARIVPVYMGTPTPAFRAAMDLFYANINRSRALAWLAEYSTATKTIGPGFYVGSFVLPGTYQGSQDPFTVGGVLNGAITNGALPYSPDFLYVVHLA